MVLYTLSSYTLSNVSKYVLKDDKIDVDAVALRYTFQEMYKHQKHFPRRIVPR